MNYRSAAARTYRPIFLSERWAHQRHLGWKLALDAPGLRLLTSKRGPFIKGLLLLSRDGQSKLQAALDIARADAPYAEVVIHDFDSVLGPTPTVGGLRWARAEPGERLLNVATIVIDLTRDADELLSDMSVRCRRYVRRAEAAGVEVEQHRHPADELVERFCSALRALASERNLGPPGLAAIRSMFQAGDAVLFVARRADAELNYLQVYTADCSAYAMNGVTLPAATAGSGKIIHWRAMQALKADGYEWFDLGGVPSQDATDGIYEFKRLFGGEFVSLGVEWRHAGWLVSGAARGARRLRRIRTHHPSLRRKSSSVKSSHSR